MNKKYLTLTCLAAAFVLNPLFASPPEGKGKPDDAAMKKMESQEKKAHSEMKKMEGDEAKMKKKAKSEEDEAEHMAEKSKEKSEKMAKEKMEKSEKMAKEKSDMSDKTEAMHKEAGKGSETGQEMREEHSRKWWKFWGE
ncbi:hypothetical protein [Coraliomargarita parva]|uniref:hypothetical protein n=1 Tax=Coraliomargarita parva TaxID=3014050 RepID=UPI0022B5DD7C|nr:hypothetical protein [Coraliomargarita parva]